jgi:hypothetical protein
MTTPIIDQEFAGLWRALDEDERSRLEASILEEGCRDPIIVWDEEDILLDGHNRLEICSEHGVNYDIRRLQFADRAAARIWMIRNQLARRNLTPTELSYYRGLRYEAEKQEQGGDRKSKSQSDTLMPTDQALAQEYGVSEATIHRDAKFAIALDTVAKKKGGKKGERFKKDVLKGKITKGEVIKEAGLPKRKTAKQTIAPDHVIHSASSDGNAVLFADILALYVPEGSSILDATWGEGSFWERTDTRRFELVRSDMEERPGADRQADFTQLPDNDEAFDTVVFDPPYKLTGTPQHTDQYRNQPGAWTNVRDAYAVGIGECYRVLKTGGILIVKCMDQVVSGKQEWYHRHVFDDAVAQGAEPEDLFVLVRATATPQPVDREQRHAHKNHSFFWVFRKP